MPVFNRNVFNPNVFNTDISLGKRKYPFVRHRRYIDKVLKISLDRLDIVKMGRTLAPIDTFTSARLKEIEVVVESLFATKLDLKSIGINSLFSLSHYKYLTPIDKLTLLNKALKDISIKKIDSVLQSRDTVINTNLQLTIYDLLKYLDSKKFLELLESLSEI